MYIYSNSDTKIVGFMDCGARIRFFMPSANSSIIPKPLYIKRFGSIEAANNTP